MATVDNKSSLDNILKAVLSVAHQEQSLFYSPRIYSEQRNVVESLLLSALVKAYPASPVVIDQIAPFVKVKTKEVTEGYIQLEEDYRDILGAPMVFATPDSRGECVQTEPLTPHNFKVGVLKAGCRLNPVVIVPQSEFAYRTRSEYDQPSWRDPIGYFMDNKRIKVCPFDITKVAVMYAKKERVVRYGYITQPDDTYLFDPATTIETEFDSAAFEPIFSAMCSLYAAYAKDQEMQVWSQILNKNGIL